MNVYVSDLIEVNKHKYMVGFVHHMPFHQEYGLNKTKEELEQEGILVDGIPEPQQIEGKSAALHCNPETKELWYEYEDIPKTPEEMQADEIKELKEQLIITQEAIDFLIMGGM